jgi:hypothetical protein
MPRGTGSPPGYPPVGIRCFAANDRLKQRIPRASFHSARALCRPLRKKNTSIVFVQIRKKEKQVYLLAVRQVCSSSPPAGDLGGESGYTADKIPF